MSQLSERYSGRRRCCHRGRSLAPPPLFLLPFIPLLSFSADKVTIHVNPKPLTPVWASEQLPVVIKCDGL
eukprot:1475536-Alexandrium_andersonii.AAC.1